MAIEEGGSKKRKKKKGRAKEKLTMEELNKYDADDLVDYITGGKRKDPPLLKDQPARSANCP